MTAIDDLTYALVDDFDVAEDVARDAVQRFAAEHPANGYEDLADAVRENTAYVVAEWMIDEGIVTP